MEPGPRLPLTAKVAAGSPEAFFHAAHRLRGSCVHPSPYPIPGYGTPAYSRKRNLLAARIPASGNNPLLIKAVTSGPRNIFRAYGARARAPYAPWVRRQDACRFRRLDRVGRVKRCRRRRGRHTLPPCRRFTCGRGGEIGARRLHITTRRVGAAERHEMEGLDDGVG